MLRLADLGLQHYVLIDETLTINDILYLYRELIN